MSRRREVRELAVRALYQMDARGPDDRDQVAASVMDAPGSEGARRDALELAEQAWGAHEQADALTEQIAPEWPVSRQAAMDRAVIRMAYYEMVSGHAPVKVAVNEAVELAKLYGTDRSPAFINGVLDKMMKRVPAPTPAPGGAGVSAEARDEAATDAADGGASVES